MSWWSIIKILDEQGENLIVEDVDKFVERLRASVRAVGLQYFGSIKTPAREGEPRKANIVVKERYIRDNPALLEIKISVRNPNTKQREYFQILMEENDEGDFYYLRAEGPSVFLTESSKVKDESALIIMISDAVERVIKAPRKFKSAFRKD